MRKGFLTGVAALAIAAASFGLAQAEDNIKQGGSMVVTYKDDVSTLDPAIGYDWQNWSMIKSLFDGLMDYEPGTSTLKKDLAEDYTISDDGTTFTFKLHKGVKFHNGREMTAEDVKYSLDRVTNPETQSPGAGFFASIKGADKMADGSAKTLEGVTVVDPYTIKIELSRPDATFLHVMAINFASVVPKEEVEKWGADFGKHPVGTGAFKLAEWTLGQKLVFERNKDYWNKGLPKLDQITFEIGQEPVVALLRLQKGEIDIPGDGIPPAKFLEIKNDPTFSKLIIEGGQLQTGYITMKTTMKPFDNVKVRQAVNMAINKERIVRIINGRAVPANQPLPPSMPGYAKDYEGYKYDLSAAKSLLAEAGYPDGFETELYVYNTDPQPRIAQAIQQDLSAIGIKAEIKALAQANVIAAGGEPDQAPMVWSGGMAWIADFPDPSNFYGPILGCAGAVKGGWNWSYYCNKDLDARAAAADSIVDPTRKEEREAAWRSIYLDIMKDAPWVPVFNEQRFTVRSERLGGPDAIFVDPVHVPVNYDQVYAKMCNNCNYTIHGAKHHYGWDRSIPPVEKVAPGSKIFFECEDSGSGHFKPESTVADVSTLDFSKVNPVTGPIYIDGAKPGDAVKVTIHEFEPSGFGWTANIPGFGLLADQFKDPALLLWKYDASTMEPALYGKHGKVPLKPFAGTIGLALAEPGLHSVVPPRRVGGNLDIRDLSSGAVLYLPVEVEGALFSIGDTHAAQGDGEVCGTAIESQMNVTVTLDLVKDANLSMPRFTTPGPVTRHLDAKGYEVTTGIGADLMEGAKAAVANMVDLLGKQYNLSAEDAYMLCSVCGDLRISEIVDMPNWVVSFYFPRIVFE